MFSFGSVMVSTGKRILELHAEVGIFLKSLKKIIADNDYALAA